MPAPFAPSPFHLDPEAFAELILDHSERVRWFKSIRCSCEDQRTGRAVRVCPNNCKNGWFFIEQTICDHPDYEDPDPPAVELGDDPGELSAGNYRYKMTFVNSLGETIPSGASDEVEIEDPDAIGKVALSAIPLGPTGAITSRKLYRTKANGSIYYLLTEIEDNTTTTYLDNIPDAELGGSGRVKIKAPTQNSLVARPHIQQQVQQIIGQSPTAMIVSTTNLYANPVLMPVSRPDMFICQERYFVEKETLIKGADDEKLGKPWAELRGVWDKNGAPIPASSYTLTTDDDGYTSFVFESGVVAEDDPYEVEYFYLQRYWAYSGPYREPRPSVSGAYLLPYRTTLVESLAEALDEGAES